MTSLRGTKTAENLLKSFAGESQARTRYTYFASVAKKEGYEQIASIFLETAENEKEHAKVFFKYLNEVNEGLEITATYPAGKIGNTKENLLAAAEGEREEWDVLYREFEKVAREEGFDVIADSFEEIAEVEEKHEERYRKLLKNILDETVFKKEVVVEWKCRNCGYIHKGKEAPESCPACDHPQSYYEVFKETY